MSLTLEYTKELVPVLEREITRLTFAIAKNQGSGSTVILLEEKRERLEEIRDAVKKDIKLRQGIEG